MGFYSREMILVETWYKNHNSKLLVIVETFKTWSHYLKDCKYEVFVFTDHNRLQRFMDIKSLSSKQVWWAQKLSQYHFEINHYLDKAKRSC